MGVMTLAARPRNHLYLLSQKLRPPSRSFFVWRPRKPQDRRELPAHLDPEASVLRRQNDRLDEAPDELPRRTCVLRPQGVVQFLDFAAVDLRDIRVQSRRRRRRRLELALELEAPSLELSELVLQSCSRLSISQSVDEPIDLPADALLFAADMGDVRPGLRLKAIPFGGEFLSEDLEQVRIHEPAAQAVHHRCLERVLADGQTIAADGLAFVARGRAAEMRLADLGEAAAADAATHQTRKEIARPSLRPKRDWLVGP